MYILSAVPSDSMFLHNIQHWRMNKIREFTDETKQKNILKNVEAEKTWEVAVVMSETKLEEDN